MKFGIVVFPGSNCDQDCYYAIRDILGCDVDYIWHTVTDLRGFDCIILPGGFSYGDYLRTGAIARFSPVMKAVKDFADGGGLVLGICNGFQILLEAGFLPGAMLRNKGLRFLCKYVHLRVENNKNPFTCLFEEHEVIRMPIAHFDGNYYADSRTIEALEARGGVVFRYSDEKGGIAPETNPNGSVGNIAAVINEAGNVLGMMPHPERCVEELLGGEDGRRLFESIVSWFSGRRGVGS
ncbi:MAG TPA: phosphoribosylformylglycinamidine synthase subunit PurQ [Clostridia bacterium]|nr:phosphoribosylformylglycinamidine synthase subunit PurQ [Clostridia bacterium]